MNPQFRSSMTMHGKTRVIHVNRLRLHILRKKTGTDATPMASKSWEEPSFHHEVFEGDTTESGDDVTEDVDQLELNYLRPLTQPDQPPLRRSQRTRLQPDRYGTFIKNCSGRATKKGGHM